MKESDGECYQTDYCVSETTYSYIQATLSKYELWPPCGELRKKEYIESNRTWIHCLQCSELNLKLRLDFIIITFVF